MDAVEEVDVLIVGGGLIGMALMHALKPLGYRVCLAEAREIEVQAKGTPSQLETRSIALSPASIRILKQLNKWDTLHDAVALIETIHISEQGRFGQALLQRDAEEALGAVVEFFLLEDALKTGLDAADLWMPAELVALTPKTGMAVLNGPSGQKKVCAKWVVAADGAHSTVRRLCQVKAEHKHYLEHALAANIALSRPHQQIAYERFTPSGPLALLPLNGLYMALVWTMPPEKAALFKQMKETDFLAALQSAFGYRTGRFLSVGPRETYPLQQVVMPKQVHERVIFIGNAAHTLHPVAGQGFNLGLRDVAMLAECFARDGLTDDALIQYQQARQPDQAMIQKATDGLVSLFKSRLPGIGCARCAGLIALDNAAPLKRMILRYAKGFGGIVPRLVCDMPLELKDR